MKIESERYLGLQGEGCSEPTARRGPLAISIKILVWYLMQTMKIQCERYLGLQGEGSSQPTKRREPLAIGIKILVWYLRLWKFMWTVFRTTWRREQGEGHWLLVQKSWCGISDYDNTVWTVSRTTGRRVHRGTYAISIKILVWYLWLWKYSVNGISDYREKGTQRAICY